MTAPLYNLPANATSRKMPAGLTIQQTTRDPEPETPRPGFEGQAGTLARSYDAMAVATSDSIQELDAWENSMKVRDLSNLCPCSPQFYHNRHSALPQEKISFWWWKFRGGAGLVGSFGFRVFNDCHEDPLPRQRFTQG